MLTIVQHEQELPKARGVREHIGEWATGLFGNALRRGHRVRDQGCVGQGGKLNHHHIHGRRGKSYRLKWTMETSMLKTLANKHKSTVTKMAAKYRTRVTTPDGALTCFQAAVEREAGKKPLVAQCGGFAIRRRKDAVVDQRPPTSYTKGSELLKRLQADACELCGSTIRVEVHHLIFFQVKGTFHLTGQPMPIRDESPRLVIELLVEA